MDSDSLAKIKNMILNRLSRNLAQKVAIHVFVGVKDSWNRKKKSLNDKSLVNGHCDFTKKIANKSALQFHKFYHVANP